MKILFCLCLLGLMQCVGLERIMTMLDSADKALRAEYDRVDRKLNPDRKPLVYEPPVVKPRNQKPQPVPMKESYVER